MFWQLYHESSKDIRKGHPPIPLDWTKWPKEWLTIEYKTYPRFKKTILPTDRPLQQSDLFQTIQQRRTRRAFDSSKEVSLQELASLLKYSCGITSASNSEEHRAQASGGGRFPIETYLLHLKKSSVLNPGIYHYDVQGHALEHLWEREFSEAEIKSFFSYPWVKDAEFAIVMTAVFPRTMIKYGERGYRFVLLEAGHIGQNMYLASEALQLKMCAIGGTYEHAVENLLDVDGMNESIVYSLIFGK